MSVFTYELPTTDRAVTWAFFRALVRRLAGVLNRYGLWNLDETTAFVLAKRRNQFSAVDLSASANLATFPAATTQLVRFDPRGDGFIRQLRARCEDASALGGDDLVFELRGTVSGLLATVTLNSSTPSASSAQLSTAFTEAGEQFFVQNATIVLGAACFWTVDLSAVIELR